MKKLLLVAVLLLLSAPAFGKGAELNIKGVKVGTLYKTVVAQLGKPVKIERSTNECAGGKDITMHYDGLRLYLLEDVNGRNFSVSSITVTSAKWLAAPSIKVGVTGKTVQAQFGKPSSKDNEDGAERWFYRTKDELNWTTFIFKNGKLVEIGQYELVC